MILRRVAALVFLWLIATPSAFPDTCLPSGTLYIEPWPECPGIGDSVSIWVYGGFPDACWSPLEFDSLVVTPVGFTVHASASRVDGKLCPGVPVPYYIDAPIGSLVPGSYAVTVVADIVSDSGYFTGTYVCDSSFLVAGNDDPNGDGATTSADVIRLVNYIFKGGAPPCGRTGDATCDGTLTAADIIYFVGYVFKSGPAPSPTCSS